MNCIIIEDQAPAQRILQKFIRDIGSIELKNTFSDGTSALQYLHRNDIDLIFLDIHLPKMTGMEFLKIKPGNALVILTTAYSEHALESYEYGVVDYLLKPFSFQRFAQAITKVQERLSISHKPSGGEVKEVFIKSGYEHIKLVVAEILFIKADADYTEIHLPGKKYLSSESLKHWLQFFDSLQFVQTHRSYLVNMSKVNRISGNRAFLENGQELPIGRVYKEALSERFLRK